MVSAWTSKLLTNTARSMMEQSLDTDFPEGPYFCIHEKIQKMDTDLHNHANDLKKCSTPRIDTRTSYQVKQSAKAHHAYAKKW